MSERPRILLVDDCANLLEGLWIFLGKRGYDVCTAGGGREGLQSYFRLRPDLVVLAIMMPGREGWELCTRIREMSDTPVILLTARGQENDKIRGLKMGADDYLVKPF